MSFWQHSSSIADASAKNPQECFLLNLPKKMLDGLFDEEPAKSLSIKFTSEDEFVFKVDGEEYGGKAHSLENHNLVVSNDTLHSYTNDVTRKLQVLPKKSIKANDTSISMTGRSIQSTLHEKQRKTVKQLSEATSATSKHSVKTRRVSIPAAKKQKISKSSPVVTPKLPKTSASVQSRTPTPPVESIPVENEPPALVTKPPVSKKKTKTKTETKSKASPPVEDDSSDLVDIALALELVSKSLDRSLPELDFSYNLKEIDRDSEALHDGVLNEISIKEKHLTTLAGLQTVDEEVDARISVAKEKLSIQLKHLRGLESSYTDCIRSMPSMIKLLSETDPS